MPPKKLSNLVSKAQLIPLLEIEESVFLFLSTRKMSTLIFKEFWFEIMSNYVSAWTLMCLIPATSFQFC